MSIIEHRLEQFLKEGSTIYDICGEMFYAKQTKAPTRQISNVLFVLFSSEV